MPNKIAKILSNIPTIILLTIDYFIVYGFLNIRINYTLLLGLFLTVIIIGESSIYLQNSKNKRILKIITIVALLLPIIYIYKDFFIETINYLINSIKTLSFNNYNVKLDLLKNKDMLFNYLLYAFLILFYNQVFFNKTTWATMLINIVSVILSVILHFNNTIIFFEILIFASVIYVTLMRGIIGELGRVKIRNHILIICLLVISLVIGLFISPIVQNVDVKGAYELINNLTLSEKEITDTLNGDYYKFLFDEKLGRIEDFNENANDKTIDFTYESNKPITRFKLYSFDYYDEEKKAFIIKDREYSDNKNAFSNSKINENDIDLYYSKLFQSYENLKDHYVEYYDVDLTMYRKDNILVYPYLNNFGINCLYNSYEDKSILSSIFDPSNSFKYKIRLIDSNYENMYQGSKYIDYYYNEYLEIPNSTKEEIEKFLSKYDINTNEGKHEIVAQIEAIFDSNYTYSNEPNPLPIGKDPINYFINTSHRGYSKHFAAAKTMIYRYFGIPARYTIGYLTSGATNTKEDVWRAQEHAWCEIFFDETGWQASELLYQEELSDEQKEEMEIPNEEEKENNEIQICKNCGTPNVAGSPGGSGDSSSNGNTPGFCKKCNSPLEGDKAYPAEESKKNTENSNDYNPNDKQEKTEKNNKDMQGKGGLLSLSGKIDYEGNDPENKEEIEDFFKKQSNEPVILIKCTNNEVERLKLSSYGDYDYETSTFLLEEDLGEFEKIDFNSLFLNNDSTYLDHEIKVNTIMKTEYAYVPYSSIYGTNMYVYQDKYYQFKTGAKDAYILNYRHIGEEQKSLSDEYTEYVMQKYLQVPEQMKEELNDFLLKNGIDKNDSKENIINKLKQVFATDFKYSLFELPEISENENPVLWFLKTKVGYCIHFSSAATLLLRECGIPTKYACGYTIKGYNKDNIGIAVNPGHAWIEIYSQDKGWQYEEVTVAPDIDDMSDTSLDEDMEIDFKEPEEEKEIKENPVEEIKEQLENKLVEGFNINWSIVAYALIAIFVVIIILILLIILIINNKKYAVTNIQKITLMYMILKQEGYVDEKVHFVMEKIRYSNHQVTKTETNVIYDAYSNMLKAYSKSKNPFKKFSINNKLQKMIIKTKIGNFKDSKKKKC